MRVNGVYYAVANNNGAWTLPAGDIQPSLANGTYDVLVEASNSAGQTAFDTTTNQLTIDTAGPTATITAPNPSTVTTPLSSIPIHFSEPIDGFSLQNLQLTYERSQRSARRRNPHHDRQSELDPRQSRGTQHSGWKLSTAR